MAQNLRTALHRAARAGSLRFEEADALSLPAFHEALVRLHASRWSERGLPGVLRDEAVLAWHADALARLHAAGLLRLHGLRLEGGLVAVALLLLDPADRPARRCYYYLGGFDPAHAAFSPGALLIARAIEQAQAESCVAFDFLRGAESYKYRWGARDVPMHTLRARSTAPQDRSPRP